MSKKLNKMVLGLVLCVAVGALAQASFHTWDISEIYSNSDGTVQFIELVENNGSNNQDEFNNRTITSNANTYTFVGALSVGNATANKRLIIGTAGYETANGSVPADYTMLPANFFNPAGDTIIFAGVDAVTFTGLPSDGVNSFHYTGANGSGQLTAANSPTNLAGNTGSLTGVPEPSSLLALLGLTGLAASRRRRK